MAISLKRRTDKPAPDAMTLVEHLTELRRRVLISAAAFLIMAVVAFLCYPWILNFLRHPYCEVAPRHCGFYVTGPLDGLALRVKIAAYGGIFLASPVWLWELWRFITPGLNPKEKRYAVPFIVATIGLFTLGAAVAFLIFPHALQWLDSIGGPSLTQILDPIKYLNLITLLMVAFGVTFEFPVLLVSLELAGVLSPKQLSSWRRWAIVGIVVLAGVITPSSDPFSMLAMAIPLYIFYELSIIIGKLLKTIAGVTPADPVSDEGPRARFERRAGVSLDPFQHRAMDAIDRGESVLVSAPTGSGKTLVADYAVSRALEAGGKAFYTTPIKALSNQKFAELGARYGADRVGLLTGDISHQSWAPVVVMTTEVLRNMLFARSALLDDLQVVVLDEVHYLQDPYRGSVWEEVLVLTPPGVAFVSLSATVNNAKDFGRWLTSVRGTTRVVVETHRPVTLHHHYAVAERGRDGVSVLPLLRNGAPNPDGLRLDDRRRRSSHQRFRAPRRTEVVEYLHDAGMLPAITFIFSRAACDDATRQVVTEGVRLTTDEERVRIRALVESSVERLSDDDLRTLGYGAWSDALEAGVAPHHAGLVPAFRQAVERCFSEGLLKVVFATETLALGINMPARTVVVERFAKFRGSDTSALTSGEYQQLTGRAGRRGIDTVGHAFVLWNQATTFGLVARTAVAPPPDLVSSFHPTYNLAVNLVRRWSREEAHGLLESSYGQWQAPPGSESLVAQLDRRLAILDDRRFLDGWALTDDGLRLAGIYHESDLLVAEILRAGLLDDLEPAHLAGVTSALTFEARRAGDDPPVPRQARVVERLAAVEAMAAGLRADERRVGLRRTRRTDGGLARAMVAWASGGTLDTVLRDAEVAPGDFVRNVRQVIDLVRQVGQVAESPATRDNADLAVALLRRGVVGADDPAALGSALDDLSPS